eukprot:2444880-Prymnesium_polylepis.1
MGDMADMQNGAPCANLGTNLFSQPRAGGGCPPARSACPCARRVRCRRPAPDRLAGRAGAPRVRR